MLDFTEQQTLRHTNKSNNCDSFVRKLLVPNIKHYDI